ncbi:MAG: GatB/YqeY domain-containing protein [Anaerolineales bacterium]
MTLKEQLTLDLKAALRSGEEPRKTVLRGLLAGLQQAELEKRTAASLKFERPQATLDPMGDLEPPALTDEQIAELERVALTEEEALAAIQKEAKSRRESIADAGRASRPDLIATNEAELRIIEHYLPQQLSREQVRALAQAAITEAGAADLKQIGAVMKLLTPRTKGLADGRLVNEVVRELLQPR